MTVTRPAPLVAIVLASWSMVMMARSAAAQDTLARVKDLYTSAAYDEALALLNEVEHPSPSEVAEVDQYRAFCLLALGRSDDARKVIQQIVEANPSFQPSDAQMSPRLQEAFREVRRRVLPSIVRKTYGDAKAAFDRKETDAARVRFTSVVALLDDADLASTSELADLRVLSKGFLDLIGPAAPPPAPATSAPAAGPRAPAPAPAPDAASARSIFGPGDTDVTPPVVISQVMPTWRPSRLETQPYEAALVLIIDETGSVESIRIEGQLQAAYAATLRRAAASWTYKPAMRNGVPVKYRKLVGIKLSPTG
jgi:tetratricopeptide (TPR) repeat protein